MISFSVERNKERITKHTSPSSQEEEGKESTMYMGRDMALPHFEYSSRSTGDHTALTPSYFSNTHQLVGWNECAWGIAAASMGVPSPGISR